jgi:hypothetical protein
MPLVHMVQVAIMQVVHMVSMNDGSVSAAGAMNVCVIFVNHVRGHRVSLDAVAAIGCSVTCAIALNNNSTTC